MNRQGQGSHQGGCRGEVGAEAKVSQTRMPKWGPNHKAARAMFKEEPLIHILHVWAGAGTECKSAKTEEKVMYKKRPMCLGRMLSIWEELDAWNTFMAEMAGYPLRITSSFAGLPGWSLWRGCLLRDDVPSPLRRLAWGSEAGQVSASDMNASDVHLPHNLIPVLLPLQLVGMETLRATLKPALSQDSLPN